MVGYTCAFSFLFWCWFWISFGSWEAIFCVVDPWWSYKALLTAVGLKGKKREEKESQNCTYAAAPRNILNLLHLKSIQVVVKTHFFSSSLARTKRVKFLSNMKPIIKAMAPPTAEAIMVASVLSTTLTADMDKRPDWPWWEKSTNKQFERFQKIDIYISCDSSAVLCGVTVLSNRDKL